MHLTAVHLGKRFSFRGIQKKFARFIVSRDPVIVSYAKNRYMVFLPFGVVVFWGLGGERQARLLHEIEELTEDRHEDSYSEDVVVVTGHGKNDIKGNKIYTSSLEYEKVGVISLVVGTSVALEHYENEVGDVLKQFGEVMNTFAAEGKSGLGTQKLLRLAAFAMKIRHISVTHLSLLDKPDIAWNDTKLDTFFSELAEEYELKDRYRSLKEKIETIFRDVEFILGYLQGKHSNFMEGVIIFLILIEIILIVYEVWWT